MALEQHPARRKEPFLFASDASDRFEEALLHAVRDNAASMRALHEAVAVCVGALRTEGMRCEAALITMKAYVSHIAMSHRAANPSGKLWAMDLLLEQIASWSITEFYRIA